MEIFAVAGSVRGSIGPENLRFAPSLPRLPARAPPIHVAMGGHGFPAQRSPDGALATTCGHFPQVTPETGTTCGFFPQVTAQNGITCG